MSDVIKEFSKPDFSVDKYTKQLVKDCVGGADLLQRKKEIQTYYEKTSATLKKSVYENYTQFIETAKEISHLESEMYQLSHILIEQRNILSSLTDDKPNVDRIRVGDTENPNDQNYESGQGQEDIESKNAARAVKETGYDGNLEGKTFLKEGALIELDANDYRPIQRVFFFLFNDVLVVCKVKHDKRLEFLAEFDPKKIAVINIKDLDGVKNAINIITPDGSKIFQSVTAAGKTEWIEKFEVAFRFDQAKKTKKRLAPQPPKVKQQTTIESPSDTKSLLSDLSPSEDFTRKAIENYGPEWIATANEEIQTLIAQRHFEDAQAFIKRTQEYLKKDNNFVKAKEIETKVKILETNLTNMLLQELSNCHCRDLQVTLRASRRPLKLLVDELGHARQAAGTLLKVCTVAIRTAQREARRNNAEISELFFCDLAQVACEFLSAFESQPACVSSLVVWCNAELQYFASQLIKHYLTKGTQLEVVAKCMEGIRKPCAKLTEIGLDLAYHLEGLLRTTLEQLIEESRVRMLETGRTEDTWQPYNLQTKSNLKRLLLELDTLGLDLRSKTTGDTWLNITQSTVVFSRHFLQLTEYCGCLAKSEVLSQSLEILLRDLLLAQQACKPTSGFSVDPNFVMKNKLFLFEDLLPIAIAKYTNISGRQCDKLNELQRQFRKQQTPVPKQRSVYQTDVF